MIKVVTDVSGNIKIEEYNDDGLKVSEKFSDGEIRYEYDKHGNKIHVKGFGKYLNSMEFWYMYEGNKLIYTKDSRGVEEWYNDEGKVLRRKYSDGDEYWEKYNKKGELLYSKDSDGEHFYIHKNGNTLDHLKSNGFESWAERDSDGHLIQYTDSNGYWRKKERDNRRHVVHYTDSNGKDYWYRDDED